MRDLNIKSTDILPIPALCPYWAYLIEICIAREEGRFIDE
jgi:hypothetical protein